MFFALASKLVFQWLRMLNDALKPDEAQKLAGGPPVIPHISSPSSLKQSSAVWGRPRPRPSKSPAGGHISTLQRPLCGSQVGAGVAVPHPTDAQTQVHPVLPDDLDTAVLYADAFFLDGEMRHKAGHVPTTAGASRPNRANSGWGFVLRLGGAWPSRLL